MRTLAHCAGATVILGVIVGTAACSGAPPLRVEATARGIRLDFETLGEYPTTVQSIRLTEVVTGTIVWAVQGKGEMQLHGVDLQEGPNPVSPDIFHGDVEV